MNAMLDYRSACPGGLFFVNVSPLAFTDPSSLQTFCRLHEIFLLIPGQTSQSTVPSAKTAAPSAGVPSQVSTSQLGPTTTITSISSSSTARSSINVPSPAMSNVTATSSIATSLSPASTIGALAHPSDSSPSGGVHVGIVLVAVAAGILGFLLLAVLAAYMRNQAEDRKKANPSLLSSEAVSESSVGVVGVQATEWRAASYGTARK
ncbi:hypothetical protein BC830DRAFT_1109285 [Chytriomyces sp. MP71]|nr:hypothetical protein BC830DRAFT_1109285 [Chytriomyces sp. MP71]